MRNSILWMLGVVCLISCGKREGEKPSPREEAPRFSEPRPEPPLPDKKEPILPAPGAPLRQKVVPLAAPHAYQVELDWHNATAQADRWVLQRLDSQGHQVRVGELEEKVRKFVDTSVRDGERYVYSLYVIRGAEQINVAEVSAIVPKDQVIDSDVGPQAIRGIARLFFTPRGRVLYGASEMKIEVDEILSDGGTLQSFGDETAAEGAHGRNAGALHLRARAGKGRLVVRANGENGGHGARGVIGLKGPDGAKGRDGTHTGSRGDIFCEYAQSGEPGGRGEPGTDGGSGGNGGASSPVVIELAEPSPIELAFENRPGAGGNAGPGGGGGDGGEGGAAGTPSSSPRCWVETRAGEKGKRGPDGNKGFAGKAGERKPSCLRNGGAAVGQCG